MKKFISILLLVCLILSAITVFAHPGDTDSNGGHYDRQNGGYHYHHGYPAHQHNGGNCPYDFDDKTGQNSGGSSKVHSSSSSRPDYSGLFILLFFTLFALILTLIQHRNEPNSENNLKEIAEAFLSNLILLPTYFVLLIFLAFYYLFKVPKIVYKFCCDNKRGLINLAIIVITVILAIIICTLIIWFTWFYKS